MSEQKDESSTDPTPAVDLDEERRDIAEVQHRLDAQADGEGLAAEAGSGEETGLSEG